MIYYGITDNNHDSSIAVFEDNQLLFASQSERFSQIKQDPLLSKSMVEYCIKKYGLPDQINYFEKPPILRNILTNGFSNLRTKSEIRKEFNHLFQKNIPIDFKDHHLSHAATGFHTSGFSDACVVVSDAIGGYDTLSIYHANDKGFKRLFNLQYPHSIGLFYSAITSYLGFKPNRDEYIVMGLSAFGKDLHSDYFIEEFFKGTTDFSIYQRNPFYSLNPKNEFKLKKNFHLELEKDALYPFEKKNIAASAQAVFERYFEKILYTARDLSNSNNLVLTGGCALNCVNNTKLANLNLFDKIWINPNPGDAGSAIGAVTLDTGSIRFKHNYLGYEIKPEYQIDEAIEELIKGKPIGIATGRAEFGPRSLGNRSLLLDPRLKNGKDLINKIKQREPFRPFAPMVLSDYAHKYFKLTKHNQQYMQFTSEVLTDEFPAIEHVDKTARVQIVYPGASMAYLLLNEWYSRTGSPILLNTSLNIKNQAMVNTWEDALEFSSRYNVNVYR